ncbi:MAG: hypothetical protein ABFD46_00500 [Armatimonadota bacterium]
MSTVRSSIIKSIFLLLLLVTPALCAEQLTIASNSRSKAVIAVPDDAKACVKIAANDLQSYIKKISGALLPIEAQSKLKYAPKIAYIVLATDTKNQSGQDSFSIRTGTVKGCSAVYLTGNNDVSTMYAAYRFLEVLGVRFFHPEEEYIPSAKTLKVGNLNITETAAYKLRGIQHHTLHHIPATKFLMNDPTDVNLKRAYNYVDWLAKNRQNYLYWWWIEPIKMRGRVDYVNKIVKYAHKRGVKVGIVVGMPFDQQQSYNLMRGKGCYFKKDVWKGYLYKGVDEVAALGVDSMCIFYGDNEWGSFRDPDGCSMAGISPVDATVERIEAVRSYMREKYPNIELVLWIHPTANIYGDKKCPNFFLLPKYCSPDIAAAVHTVQFYDLVSPAPTYSNKDFHFLYQFALEQAEARPIWFWPETAFACGFDNDVPMYFPCYITARWRDAELMSNTAVAHITFSSSIEWMYWLNDYAVARFGWNPDEYSVDRVVSDFTDVLGKSAGPVAKEVLLDLAKSDERYLMDLVAKKNCNLMNLLNESVMYRVLDTLPGKADKFLNGWKTANLVPLQEFTACYKSAFDKLKAVAPKVSPAAKPLFDEFIDTIEMTYLRLEHQSDVYGQMIDLGLAENSGIAMEPDMRRLVNIQNRAKKIIAERESHYRYPTGGAEGNYYDFMRPFTVWETFAGRLAICKPYSGIRKHIRLTPNRISITRPSDTRKDVVVHVPGDFPVDKPLCLYLGVEDTDTASEGRLEINGKSIALPASGDSNAICVKIDLPANLLKPGDNTFTFHLENASNNGTKGYYVIYGCIVAAAYR